jgi:hypothetical protein
MRSWPTSISAFRPVSTISRAISRKQAPGNTAGTLRIEKGLLISRDADKEQDLQSGTAASMKTPPKPYTQDHCERLMESKLVELKRK